MKQSLKDIIIKVQGLQSARKHLLKQNEVLFNEQIRYRTEREMYHRNPTPASDRFVKEHTADMMFDYYKKQFSINSEFLDKIETSMGELVWEIDDQISIDGFIRSYLP